MYFSVRDKEKREKDGRNHRKSPRGSGFLAGFAYSILLFYCLLILDCDSLTLVQTRAENRGVTDDCCNCYNCESNRSDNTSHNPFTFLKLSFMCFFMRVTLDPFLLLCFSFDAAKVRPFERNYIKNMPNSIKIAHFVDLSQKNGEREEKEKQAKVKEKKAVPNE